MNLNQSGYIGGLQADSFNDKANLLHQTKETQKAKDANLDQQNINANLGTNNQALMNGNAMLADKNRELKEMLARPLMEILDENADLKKALEEQKQLIALWMLRQRAMKKVAIDFGKEKGYSLDKVIEVSEEKETQILNGNTLDGVVTDGNMKYFAKHKQYLIKNYK